MEQDPALSRSTVAFAVSTGPPVYRAVRTSLGQAHPPALVVAGMGAVMAGAVALLIHRRPGLATA